jgi:adenosylcobyric acid synthase
VYVPGSMTAKPIFIGGTGSHVGKSWVATALCRYLHRLGYRVAPFKAQNMSNNSMVCPGGGEIGRAQAAQAEACRIDPHPDMNPILLKPTGSFGSQVVLNGRPWRNLQAADYYEHYDYLLERVLGSYARLAAEYDYVVIEGAGSTSELNLKHRDLVNLGLAARLGAPCLLVADIDRGGVFASVVGSFDLLDERESLLVRSFMVNRFRGDIGLFGNGVNILEEKTGRPCLGVFPYMPDIHLDAEDSVSLDERPLPGRSRVAIVRFPHISNFTDFRLLSDAVYLSRPVPERFDAIFLPGTKSTIEDMLWLRSIGMDRWLIEQAKSGTRIVGVCGGYQMLGEEIVDPGAVESPTSSVRGLGLLPVHTRILPEKTTRAVRARTALGHSFDAYEIHMGLTTVEGNNPPFATLQDGTADGVRAQNAIGTYLHGAFENRVVLEEVLGYSIPDQVEGSQAEGSKDAQYDRLADWFSQHARHDVLHTEYLGG